jgi:threonine/homoserine/homoserine lactone efflux protein
MNIEVLIAFSIGMIILAVTPGIGVFSSVAQAVSSGFISSLFFVSGLILGDIIFFLLAVIGITAISEIMGEIFFIIRITGGVYLIYLGIKTLKKNGAESGTHTFLNTKKSRKKVFLSGLLVTLGNPKPILFYASVVPTIVDIDKIQLNEVLILISLIAAISYIVVGSYCYAASLSKKIMTKSSYKRKLDNLAGFTIIAAGCYIIIKK